MQTILPFQIFYFIFLCFFAYQLFILRSKFHTKFGYHCEISTLGEDKFKFSSRFRLLLMLFGITSCILTWSLSQFNGVNGKESVGIAFLYLNSIFSIWAAIFTRDRFTIFHAVVGGALFLSIMGASLSLISFMKNYSETFHFVWIINLAILTDISIYFLAKLYELALYRSKKTIRASIFEWIGFYLVIFWNLSVTLFLILDSL